MAFGSLSGSPMMGMDPRMAQLMPMAMQMMRNGGAGGGGQPQQPGTPPMMPPAQPGAAPMPGAPPGGGTGMLSNALGIGGPGNGLLNQLMQKFRQQPPAPGQPMNINPSAGAPGAMIPPIPVAGQPAPGPNQLTGMW